MFSFIGKPLANRRRNSGYNGSDTATSRVYAKLVNYADLIWVRLVGRHVIGPTSLGRGSHDCALTSLYWTAPTIPEDRIIEAFKYCTANWPYGGVTNTEFAIALKYLKTPTCYSAEPQILKTLLNVKPYKCVALLHGHFIAIVRGTIVGSDADRSWPSDTKVYCHWTFR